MVRIDFEVKTEHGVFRDAIVLPEDHNLTEKQIQAIKDQRVANWIEAINTPAEEIEEPPSDAEQPSEAEAQPAEE